MMDEIKRSIENEDTSVNKAVDTFVNLLYYQLYECAQDKIEIEKRNPLGRKLCQYTVKSVDKDLM